MNPSRIYGTLITSSSHQMIVNQYELKILLKVVVSMVLCQSERISFLALKVRGTEKDRTQCSHLKERFTS